MIKVQKRIGMGGKKLAFEAIKKVIRRRVEKDMTQRQAFSELMPKLYALRNDGFSFTQIADLLTKCGMSLKVGTVRSYYNDMLLKRAEELQKTSSEQVSLMSKVMLGARFLWDSAASSKVLH